MKTGKKLAVNASKGGSLKPTLKDIAAAAGVSSASVSNTLNGRKGVSEAVRMDAMFPVEVLGHACGLCCVSGWHQP